MASPPQPKGWGIGIRKPLLSKEFPLTAFILLQAIPLSDDVLFHRLFRIIWDYPDTIPMLPETACPCVHAETGEAFEQQPRGRSLQSVHRSGKLRSVTSSQQEVNVIHHTIAGYHLDLLFIRDLNYQLSNGFANFTQQQPLTPLGREPDMVERQLLCPSLSMPQPSGWGSVCLSRCQHPPRPRLTSPDPRNRPR